MRRGVTWILLSGCMAAACGGGGGAGPGDTEPFVEPPPSPEEVAALVAGLETEHQALVPAATRQAWSAYALAPPPFEPPAGALEREPASEAEVWRMLGLHGVLRGSASAAAWAYLRALSLEPEDASSLSQLAFLLAYQGRAAEALPLALRAASLAPAEPAVLTTLGGAYRAAGDLPRAAHQLTLALALRPNDPRAHLRLARVWRERGEPDQARPLLEVAALLAPEDADIQAELGALPPPAPRPPPPLGRLEQAAEQPTLREFITAGMEEPRQRYQQAMDSADAAWQAPLTVRLDQRAVNGGNASACLDACGGDEGCSQGCQLAFCQAELASDASYAAALPAPASQYVAIETTLAAAYEAVYWEGLARYAEVAGAEQLAAVEAELDLYVGQCHSAVQTYYVAVQLAVLADLAQIEPTCQGLVAMPPVDLAALLSEDPEDGPSFSLCLDGVACLGLADGSLALSVSAGALQGEVGLDLQSGHFTLGLGLGARDPSGLLDASISVKVSSEKGLGIGLDASAGGIVRGKVSQDYWLSD